MECCILLEHSYAQSVPTPMARELHQQQEVKRRQHDQQHMRHKVPQLGPLMQQRRIKEVPTVFIETKKNDFWDFLELNYRIFVDL